MTGVLTIIFVLGMNSFVTWAYLILLGAGMGIRFWDAKNSHTSRIRYLFAILGFPLFSWFPLVAYFSTIFLLRFFSWQNIAIIWSVVISTSTILWFRGQQLDYQSRNPLQGLIPNPKEAQGISLKKSKKGLLYE